MNPATLATRIIDRGEKSRRAEARVYRRKVGEKALALGSGLHDESRKQAENRNRASSAGKAGL